MKIFGIEIRKIKSEVQKLPVSKYTSGGLFYYSPRMSAAELLANSTVNACTNIIADAVASLTLNVYRKGENGREKVTDISLAKLLKTNPNYDDTAYTFKQKIMLHLLLRGNAFIFVERNWDYTVRALYALDPDTVEICRDDQKDVYYKISVDGKTYKCSTETILHIPAIRYNRLRGISPMEYSTNCAKIGLELDEYTQNYFDGGINSRLLVTVPVEQKNWTKEDSQKLSEQLLSSYGGRNNANKPLILSKGLTASPINVSGNSDSQLVENRKFSEKEIAKIFRVPLFML
ncbi:phage portal protein, partial [uncultured Treponema sp.]|uniref:phage portal protein n=1 Tax=uncultured Treponema sp. TaxID=162155 RepID=UPI0015BCCE8E